MDERIVKYRNAQGKNPRSHEQLVNAHLSDLLAFVNWDYITLPALLDVCRNQPLFRQNVVFAQVVQSQFALRQNMNDSAALKQAKLL